MGTLKALQKHICVDGNPILRISQDTDGNIYIGWTDPKYDGHGKEIKGDLQFHISREGTKFHYKYRDNDGHMKKTSAEERSELKNSDGEETLVENFIIVDTTSYRIPREKPREILLNVKRLHPKAWFDITVKINPNSTVHSKPGYDVVYDEEFEKTLFLSVRQFLPPLTKSASVMI